jgi:type IV secretion system protein VirB6
MSCVPVRSGEAFVRSFLDHVDCQARTLGSFGYQSLADPASPLSAVLTGLLTLFIALFALRLLFGERLPYRDALDGVLRIGIVLLLATSWPAFRVLIYDVVTDGAQQIARPIAGASGLAPADAGFAARLQLVDRGIARLTREGSGRNQAVEVEGAPAPPANAALREVVMPDNVGWSTARVFYLIGAIAPLALLRMAAGILLALAPLFALLLLFDATRGIFANWLGGLFATLVGTIAISLVLAAELAIVEPWLADALTRRSESVMLLDAPTELLAMTTAFALIGAGMLYLVIRVSFATSSQVRVVVQAMTQAASAQAIRGNMRQLVETPPVADRHFQLTDRLRHSSGWGERAIVENPSTGTTTSIAGPTGSPEAAAGRGPSLGQVYRRTRHRPMASARGRDSRNG